MLCLSSRKLSTRMLLHGMPCSLHLSTIISHVCASLKAFNQGKQVHLLLVVSGSASTVESTALVDFYTSCGLISDAFRVFYGLECQEDDAICNALLSGCLQNHHYVDAFVVIRNMQANRNALTTFLSACSELSDLSRGKEIHSVGIRQGFEADTLFGNALLDMYAKCGMLSRALSVFNRIAIKSLVTWTSIITAYGAHGCGLEALKIFRDMGNVLNGVSPNSVTLLAVLSACKHSGLVEAARECFFNISAEYGIHLLPEHYACLIELLGRAGRLEEVWKLYDAMKRDCELTGEIWAAILGACIINRDVLGGEYAAKKLLKMEPHNPGNYIMLSNLYAAAGKWDTVEELRWIMCKKGLRKEMSGSFSDWGLEAAAVT